MSYVTGTAVCCLVAICLVANRDLALRESGRIPIRAFGMGIEGGGLLNSNRFVPTEDDELSILLMKGFTLRSKHFSLVGTVREGF